jgi:hypothetical protein
MLKRRWLRAFIAMMIGGVIVAAAPAYAAVIGQPSVVGMDEWGH